MAGLDLRYGTSGAATLGDARSQSKKLTPEIGVKWQFFVKKRKCPFKSGPVL